MDSRYYSWIIWKIKTACNVIDFIINVKIWTHFSDNLFADIKKMKKKITFKKNRYSRYGIRWSLRSIWRVHVSSDKIGAFHVNTAMSDFGTKWVSLGQIQDFSDQILVRTEIWSEKVPIGANLTLFGTEPCTGQTCSSE